MQADSRFFFFFNFVTSVRSSKVVTVDKSFPFEYLHFGKEIWHIEF